MPLYTKHLISSHMSW